MKPTKTGRRVVVIGGTAPANATSASREPPNPRPTPRRIVVIQNGELVGRRPGR
jgi:hypothetical protein